LRFIVNCPKNREISMNLTKMMLAGAIFAAVPSVTFAQQSLTGTITTIDRLNGTIAIRQTPSGTVGANGGGATVQEFKAPGALLDTVHAGDKVTISAGEVGGKKTITKMDRQ
jgi:Cu/Ag efflux protein CusF